MALAVVGGSGRNGFAGGFELAVKRPVVAIHVRFLEIGFGGGALRSALCGLRADVLPPLVNPCAPLRC